jgi:signal transduction histidine kinase/CheY-like chemotaxis protein
LVYSLTGLELANLMGATIVACALLFLAVLAYRRPRYRGQQSLYFSISLCALTWSVFNIGLLNAGLSAYHPSLPALSPLLSGLAPTAFFLYCKTILYPNERVNPWWLLFALPGTAYTIIALLHPDGLAFLSSVMNEAAQQHHPLLTPLFTVHSVILIGFTMAALIMVSSAYFKTEIPGRKKTIASLATALFSGLLILIVTNILPLLGVVNWMGLQAILSLPIAALMYRSLLTYWEEVDDEIKINKARHDRMISLGRMARGVAHDFNNLLAGIMGHAELARIQKEDATAVEAHLLQITETLDHAGALQRKLLAFSGGPRTPTASISAEALLQRVLNNLQSTLPTGFRLKCDLQTEGCFVQLSSGDLHSALNNLLTNATEAMPSGGSIQISAKIKERLTPPKGAIGESLKGQAYLQLRISDNGPGMSPVALSHMFEPFFSTKGQGRGLGLASIIATVQESRGVLWATSTLGAGTTITLNFPLAKKADPSEAQRVPDEPKKEMTVLLVDDDPAVLSVLEQLLSALGQKVVSVTNGKSALALFLECPESFDWALIDVQMKGMDGIALAQHLRANSKTLRIHLMSGDEPMDRIQETFKDEPIELLRKPFNVESLKVLCAPAKA